MSQLGLEAARASYLAMQELAEQDPRDLAVIRDLTCPGPAGRSRCASTTRATHANPARS
jgi:hypothetical protein